MIKLEQARAEIAAIIQQAVTDWPDYPLVVETDNGECVDQKTQMDPYLKLSVRNMRGEQLDLGDDPTTEQRGQILVCVCVRKGEGTAKALKLLGHIAPYLAMKDSTLVRCHTFQAVGGKEVDGWWCESGIVNYWYLWRKSS